MIRQSVLLELEKQKRNILWTSRKKTNSSKVKSLSKRKSKFTSRCSRGKDKRKKFMHDNFGEDEKEQLKNKDKKRKKEMLDNLDEGKNKY